MKTPNLRDMEITTGSGKDVKDTNQLKGEAVPSAAFKQKNVMREHSVGTNMGSGKLGGKNAGM